MCDNPIDVSDKDFLFKFLSDKWIEAVDFRKDEYGETEDEAQDSMEFLREKMI